VREKNSFVTMSDVLVRQTGLQTGRGTDKAGGGLGGKIKARGGVASSDVGPEKNSGLKRHRPGGEHGQEGGTWGE